MADDTRIDAALDNLAEQRAQTGFTLIELLVICPIHNVITCDPSDNYETDPLLCAAIDQRPAKRTEQVGSVAVTVRG